MFSLILFVVVCVQFFVTGNHISLGWFIPTLVVDSIIVFGHDYYTTQKKKRV